MADPLDGRFSHWQVGPGGNDGAGHWPAGHWQIPNFQHWQHTRRPRRVIVGGRPGPPVRDPLLSEEDWLEIWLDWIAQDDEEFLLLS